MYHSQQPSSITNLSFRSIDFFRVIKGKLRTTALFFIIK